MSNIRTIAVDALVRAYQPFDLKSVCYPLDLLKNQGYPISTLVLTLLLLPFLGVESIHGLYSGAYQHVFTGAKDCLYRLKNNEWIAWRKLLYRFNKRYNQLADKHTVQVEGKKAKPKCLIVDDSLLNHTGKTIEGVSKVYDHVIKRTVLGFKLLVLGYFDGISFRPLDFSLHREGKNRERNRFGLPARWLKKQFHKLRDKYAPGYQRFKELDIDKNSQFITMIKRALKHGYVPDYVLFDSWFCCEKTLKVIRGLRKGIIHVVAACKMGRTHYNYLGVQMTAGKILQTLQKKRKQKPKRCRLLKCHYHTVVVEYKGLEIRLFFVRYSKRGKWSLLMN